jgi:hypothetical protein
METMHIPKRQLLGTRGQLHSRTRNVPSREDITILDDAQVDDWQLANS